MPATAIALLAMFAQMERIYTDMLERISPDKGEGCELRSSSVRRVRATCAGRSPGRGVGLFFAQVSAEALMRHQAERDPARRR
jgi:hypothetical protein